MSASFQATLAGKPRQMSPIRAAVPRILVLAVLPLLTLGARGNDSDYQFFPPGPMLNDVKASPLLVAPKAVKPTFGVSLIGADTGGGTNPLKGDGAKRATRFYGQCARSEKGSTPAGSLQRCAARPEQFDKICEQAAADGDTVYFTGMVGSVKVRAFGFGYPHAPTKATDFTTSVEQMPWVRS